MEPNNILIEIDKCCLHHIQQSGKQMIEYGQFRLTRSHGDTNIAFISINKFTHCLSVDMVVMRAEFEKTVSYFLEYLGGGYYVVSFDRQPRVPDAIDGFFKDLCRLTPYEEYITNDEQKQRLQEHWPYLFTGEPVYSADLVTTTINSSGKILEKGFIKTGQILKGGVDKAATYLQSKIENKSTVDIGKAKSVFQKVKSGVGKAFQVSCKVVSAVVDPAINKVKQLNGKLCEKIDKSENRTLKYLKDITSTSNTALQNVFYGLSTAVGDVGKSLADGTGAIIEKKFGEHENAEPSPLNEEASNAHLHELEGPQRRQFEEKETSSLEVVTTEEKATESVVEKHSDIPASLLNVETARSEPDEEQTTPAAQPHTEDKPAISVSLTVPES